MAEKHAAQTEEDDVSILPPDYSLKQAIGNMELGKLLDEAVIQKTQSNLEKQQENFLIWITEDLAKIDYAYSRIKPPSPDKAQLAKLIEAALAIKSHAGTFGYSLASQVARSLYTFCEHFSFTEGQYVVVSKHIEIIKLIFDKGLKGDGDAQGKELLHYLEKLKSKFR